MKVKRYMGNNFQEAMLKVKVEMGDDALILNTKKIRKKGLFGIFSKPMVEILAALDESRKMDSEIQTKVNNMEEILKRIYLKMQNSSYTTGLNRRKSCISSYTAMMELFYNNLVKNEVDEEIARAIVEDAGKKAGKDAGINDFISILYNYITGIFKSPETIHVKDKKPTVVMFTGPTGVGKTTTLAKIAARCKINHKMDIALITDDTYRIAAAEQLKTYADIMEIPLSVVYSASDAREAVNSFKDKELVLIDTAGRNHKNAKQYAELKNMINLLGVDDVYLVLSMANSKKHTMEVIESYGFLDNYKLIFTKADEASSQGLILNTVYYAKKPLSYITTGQEIPDDIEVADIDKITKNLLGTKGK
ncbi:MAG: flagellar biosynthesis protein FlhF [Clostridiaceae bacterium]|nr:flagellar biosynthesis protein FlhF [Clostridiaceae bacterium]